jgi:hypothetical protein
VRDYSYKVSGGWPTLLLHPHDATDFVVRLMPGKLNQDLRQLFGDDIRSKLFDVGSPSAPPAGGEGGMMVADGEAHGALATVAEEDEILDDETTEEEEPAAGVCPRVQLKDVGPSLLYSARDYVAGAGAALQERFGPALDRAVREQQGLAKAFRWNTVAAVPAVVVVDRQAPEADEDDDIDRAGLSKADDNGASGGLPVGWKRAVDSQAPKVNDNGASGGLPVGSSRLEAFMSVPVGWKRAASPSNMVVAEEERPPKKQLTAEERKERVTRSVFTCEILDHIEALSKPERKLSKGDIQLLSSKYVELTKETFEMKTFHDTVGVIDHVAESLSRLSAMQGRLSDENYKCMHEGLMECLRF